EVVVAPGGKGWGCALQGVGDALQEGPGAHGQMEDAVVLQLELVSLLCKLDEVALIGVLCCTRHSLTQGLESKETQILQYPSAQGAVAVPPVVGGSLVDPDVSPGLHVHIVSRHDPSPASVPARPRP